MKRVALRNKRPYAWGLDSSGVDDEFDDIESFEGAVIDGIRRCGTVDIHPNDWGRHDSVGVNTDNMHYSPDDNLSETIAKQPNAYARRKAEEAKRQETKLSSEEAYRIERDELMAKVAAFPHANHSIAFYTALELMQFGKTDAIRRGITDDEWLWKRSRFMAGFK